MEDIKMETVTSPSTNYSANENQNEVDLLEHQTSTAIRPVLGNPNSKAILIMGNQQSNYAAGASSSKVILGNSSIDAYLRSFPPGFRFKPTDEELIVHYLLRKIQNNPPYPSRIHDADIYTESPFYLSENYAAANETEWYFLSPREKKYERGNRPNRTAGNGYWKATGADKNIKSSKCKVDVGVVKTLVYLVGTHKEPTKTNWIMKEYRIKKSPPSRLQGKRAHSTARNRSNLAKSSQKCMKLDDYVLYKIYKNKSNASNATNVVEGEASDQDHEPLENHDGVAQQEDIHQDHGVPDEYLGTGDHIYQQPHADNIHEIDYSANQQQQQQLWTNPYTSQLGYNNHVFPNDGSMVIPGNGFYDQNQELMLHETLYNQQNVSVYDYIPPDQAMLPADACNNMQALNHAPNISEGFSPSMAMAPVDASNDVQVFNNEINVPQMQQQQYQQMSTMPSSFSTYHP